MTDFVAALDGGGTKTNLAWADASGNLGQFHIAKGCNPQDSSRWVAQVRSALNAMPAPPVHIVLGIGGFGEVPAIDRAVQRAIARLCPGTATVMNDVALACQGAFPTGGGVLMLSGTGSMAMAVGPKGLRRTGGWGDAYGDEGSAYWIGQNALSRASQMLDGRLPSTGFDLALCARLGVLSNDGGFDLMSWVQANAHPRPTVASVAAHVDALARKGNADALRILDLAAEHLYLHTAAAASLAGLAGDWPWSTAGSVFRSAILTQNLTALIGRPPQPAKHSALIGGLVLAARAAGWPETREWVAKLEETGS